MKQNTGLGAMNRRQLLTALGLTGAGLFLPSLGWKRNQAKAQSVVPKRLVIFATAHGAVPETWRMTRDNPGFGNWEYPFDSSDASTFSEILRPLHPHREKLLVIEGLSQMSTLGDYSTNNHNAATQHLLTGAMMVDDNNAGGPSVDQIIAQQVAIPGRIPSLELSSMAGMAMGGFVNSAPSQRTPTSDNPQAVFDRLFPPGSTPTSPGEEPPMPTERDLIRGARRSVLDLVADEYEAIAPRLGADDRQRLDQHRQLVRDLELRVGSLAQLNCGAPERTGVSNNADQPSIIRAQMELAAAALACDLTRVVTIQLPEMYNSEFGAPPGDVHQDYAHQTNSSEEARTQMTNYNRIQADLFAHLLTTLDQYGEGDGTLLDNTAAVWLTELATGPHDLWEIPVVIGGSCGGAFRVGRYMSYAQDIANPVENPDWEAHAAHALIGPGHNHLLISLMQAMGLENDSIGATSVQTRTASSQTISLTGGLDRLS
jgi:hypothetical protein